MRVHFLSTRTYKAHCFTYPIRTFAEHLKQLGVSVRIFFAPSPQLYDCDVLCVIDDFFRADIPRNGATILSFLLVCRRRVPAVVWCDTRDGAGAAFFDVLPFVDLYVKSQLVKNRKEYTREWYGLEYHTDYYHRHNNILDDPVCQWRAAPLDQLHKIEVSWNVGLGDFYTNSKWHRRLRILLAAKGYGWRISSHDDFPRYIAVSCRISTHYRRATVRFQREETLRRITPMVSKYRIASGGKVPYDKYIAELKHSQVVLSPFGFGEICLRDFEAIRFGAALFKPAMEHLDTFPMWYESDVTYVSHAWDFADFRDKLIALLDSPERCRQIASAAQQKWLNAHSDEGGRLFARHFANLVRRANPKLT